MGRDVLGDSITVITSDGSVEWNPSINIKAWCNITDLGHWPIDTHACLVSLGVRNEFEFLQLHLDKEESDILGEHFQTEWDVQQVTVIDNFNWTFKTSSNTLPPFFKIEFKLKRSSTVYTAVFFTPFLGTCFTFMYFEYKLDFILSYCCIDAVVLLRITVWLLKNKFRLSSTCHNLVVLVTLAHVIPILPDRVPYLVLLYSHSCIASAICILISVVVTNLSRSKYKTNIPHLMWKFLTWYPIRFALILPNVQVSGNYGALDEIAMVDYNTSNSALSNLSLDSISEDEFEPWHGLIQKLSVFHLESLHAIFKAKGSSCKYETYAKLSREDFIRAVENVFGNCKHSLQASLLYAQIDKENNDKISWDQFLDFLIEQYQIEVKPAIEMTTINIFNPPHVKRDTIAKIVLIETETYFCYAILSNTDTYNKKEDERRRRNRWVTDAIFVKDVLMMFIATSTRSVTIYDASGLTHVPLWLILGIPNIVERLSWCSDYDEKHHILFLGDTKGQLISMTFLHFHNELLRKKNNDKLNFFYWRQLQGEKDFVLIKNYGHIHNDGINRMHFDSEKKVIVTCSGDSDQSVIFKSLTDNMKNYVFKIHRGATCYAVSNFLKTLITGCADGVIHIWNTVVTSAPTATLKSHESAVIDVQIMETHALFLSCSIDGVLKLWSIKSENCLQSIRINFPSFQILGKTIEWGVNTIYPGPKRHVYETDDFISKVDNVWRRSYIFVACCNHLAKINLVFQDDVESNMTVLPPPPLQNSVLIPTHWRILDDAERLESSSSSTSDYTEEVVDPKLTERLESLKFILKKDLLTENDMRSDINYRLACLETKKLKMKEFVSQCAPYLALELPAIEEIQLSPNLPIPTSRRMKSLIEKTHRLLSEAATKSHASLQHSTTSRTLSSRSSIITFEYSLLSPSKFWDDKLTVDINSKETIEVHEIGEDNQAEESHVSEDDRVTDKVQATHDLETEAENTLDETGEISKTEE
ncbi:hypothetical protein FQR65_LT05307 [Abscondita terminalis]|nr:hypothetical protein FQR65_LT05307 [Abscondita terminalis]